MEGGWGSLVSGGGGREVWSEVLFQSNSSVPCSAYQARFFFIVLWFCSKFFFKIFQPPPLSHKKVKRSTQSGFNMVNDLRARPQAPILLLILHGGGGGAESGCADFIC